ncbi:MAG: acyltransferase [Rubrivivax sp.]|nr:acyltransferase [Rubrivivax sp.]
MLARRATELRIGVNSVVSSWRFRINAPCSLRIGDHSIVETRLTVECENAQIEIGNRSFVGLGYISCASSIVIGDDVMIAWGSAIFDHGSHALRFSERANDVKNWLGRHKDWTKVTMAPVQICNKAWVGYGSIILPGVCIGEGAVVGAGSVVTRDVPPWSVAVGNPARVIRELPQNER